MKKQNDQPILTIGIPTYNRPDDLLRLLQQIAGSEVVLKECCVLVIDDGSSGLNEDFLDEKNLPLNFLEHKLQYVKNHQNIGYPRTFIRLFEECRTDYLLILSDDNLLLEDGFLKAVEHVKLLRPSFMSSPWMQGGGIAHRTWKRNSPDTVIGVADFFRSSDHAPGLIYECAKAKKYLNAIESRIALRCSFTAVFPQVNLALNLILHEDNCRYFAKPIGTENSLRPSGIKDSSGQDWRTYRSLLRQAADLDEYISTFPATAEKKKINIGAQKYYLNYFFKLVDPEVEKFFQIFFTNRFLFTKTLSRLKSPLKSIGRSVKKVFG